MNFVVGIPTLNRYDLIGRCIGNLFSGTLQPQKVYVVDNGDGYRKSREAALLARDDRIEIITPQRNLGVSASWNILHRLTRPTRLILVNDDVFVGKNTMQVLMEEEGPCIATALGWSCFRHDHEVWDQIGDYDEFFFPAYYEDNDMDWRRHIGGAKRVICENLTDPIEHMPSSTLRSMDGDEQMALKQHHARSTRYYRAKWGGLPKSANDPTSGEKFDKPFNGASPEAIAEIIRNLNSPEVYGMPRMLVGGQRS